MVSVQQINTSQVWVRMTAEVGCPNPDCHYIARASEKDLGRSVKCKLCGTRFALTLPAASLKPQDTQAGSRLTMPTDSASTPRAKNLGRYEILSHLGSGAFGAVYRAHDPQLDRDVALKVPHTAKLRDRSFVKRFLNEAKATARLQHPYIVPLFDAGKDGNRYYIASAFIEGGTLEEAINERTFEFRETTRIVMQLAEALAYAHKQGIVHRDVKPDNIMLDKNGEPHLMDFGLARLETSDEKLTQDGTVMGTPAYMSPEQARGVTDDISAASDQYSLGATLYEMLCGEIPFSGSPEIVIFHVIQTDPARPQSIKASVPSDLETICLKAMSKDPADRYESCRHMAEDLRRCLNNEPIAAHKVGRVERLVRWSKREPIVSGLAFAVLLVFAAGLAVSSWQWNVARKQSALATTASEQERRARIAASNANEQLENANQQLEKSLESERAALKRARSGLYGFQFHEIQKACLNSQHDTAHQILQKLAQDSEYSDLRSWEWWLMDGALTVPEPMQVIEDSDSSVPSAADMGTQAISWSSDGSKIALPRRSPSGVNVFDVQDGLLVKSYDGPVRAFSWGVHQPELAIMRDSAVEFHSDIGNGKSNSSTSVALPELSQPKTKHAAQLVWNPQASQIAAIRRIADQKQGVLSGHITVINRNAKEPVWTQSWDDKSPVGCCWSPDGTQIAVGFILKSQRSGDDNVHILNASNGTLIGTIDPEEHRPDYMQWSHDGELIYFGSKGGGSGHLYSTRSHRLHWATVHTHAPRFAAHAAFLGQPAYRHLGIWNLDRQSRRILLWGHRVQGLAWGHNAKRLAIGVRGKGRGPQPANRIEVFEHSAIPTPYVEFMNRGNNDYAFSDIAWSPAGGSLSAITADGSIWLIDAEQTKITRKTKPLGNAEYNLRWQDHPSRLIVADSKGELILFDAPNLNESKRIKLEQPIRDMEWNSASEQIWIAAGENDLITLSGPLSKATPKRMPVTNKIERLKRRALNPGFYLLDTAGNVSLSTNAAGQASVLIGKVEPGAISMSCDQSESQFMFSYADGTCSMYSKDDDGLTFAWSMPSAGVDAEFHPTEDRIAIIRSNGDVTIANANDGTVMLDLNEKLYSPFNRSRSEFQPTKLEWSPDGRSLAVAGYCRGWSGTNYGMIGIWNAVSYARSSHLNAAK